MILTQTEDLIDEDSFLRDSFLNQDKPVTRVGVFEEDFATLKSGLDAFMSGEGVSSSNLVVKKEIPFEDPRSESKSRGKLIGHIFVVISLSNVNLPPFDPKFATKNQFYYWKRVHFQVIFTRGVKSLNQPDAYRWIPAEPDDIGENRLPAESYEAFQVRPAQNDYRIDGNTGAGGDGGDGGGGGGGHVGGGGGVAGGGIFVPVDKRLFISEKESSEFKECPKHSAATRRKFENNWRGKMVADPKEIRKYMTSIMAVKRLVRPYGIRSWMNCGTLLGWYRQCSLIPKDPDIDMLHYSSPEFYPKIHADILAKKDTFHIIKLGVNQDAPREKGGYQRGFYWKLGVTGGINVDTYFYFSHKVYNMKHKKGDIKFFDFTDKICSADLHGYRVYVLCDENKNRDLSRVYYGPDIFKPR